MLELDNKDVIKECNSLWLKNGLYFPGPQPISIEYKHIDLMKASPSNYKCAIKNDGVRYMICCLKHKEKNIFSIFNRNFEQKLLRIKAKRELFDGTLIDCEFINDNTFVLFDCILINGNNVSNLPFSQRLSYLKTFIKEIDTTEYNFIIKEFVPYSSFQSYVENIKDDMKNDGYIFMPDNEKIHIGTHNNFFKWKHCFSNTVDFSINSLGTMHLVNKNEIVKTRNKLESIPSYIKNQPTEQIIVECECIHIDKKLWKPICIRSDKNLPNSTYVFKKTIQNIKDNISLRSLFI